MAPGGYVALRMYVFATVGIRRRQPVPYRGTLLELVNAEMRASHVFSVRGPRRCQGMCTSFSCNVSTYMYASTVAHHLLLCRMFSPQRRRQTYVVSFPAATTYLWV
jgi:hypothetical protein